MSGNELAFGLTQNLPRDVKLNDGRSLGMRGEFRKPFVRKLSQLHKVVEYLSFHLAEDVFQAGELRRRFEAAEDELTRELDQKAAEVAVKWQTQNKEVEREVRRAFDAEVDAMIGEIERVRSEEIGKIDAVKGEVEKFVESWNLELEKISARINEQFEFLQNDANFRPDAETLEKERKFREAIRIHDAESARKEKLLLEQTEKRENALSIPYWRTILELRASLRLPKPFRKRIEILGGRMLDRVKSIRDELGRWRADCSENVFARMRAEAKLCTGEIVRLGSLRERFMRDMADEDARHGEVMTGILLEQRKRVREWDLEIEKLKLEVRGQDAVRRLAGLRVRVDQFNELASLRERNKRLREEMAQEKEKVMEWAAAVKELARVKNGGEDLGIAIENEDGLRKELDMEYERECEKRQEEITETRRVLEADQEAHRIRNEEQKRFILETLEREFSQEQTAPGDMEELDKEISALTQELEALEQGEKELLAVTSDCSQKLSAARQQYEEARMSVQAQVAAESEKHAALIRGEMERQRVETEEFRAQLDKLKAQLAGIQKKTSDEVAGLTKTLQARKTKLAQTHKKEVNTQNNAVVKLRESLSNGTQLTLELMKKHQTAYDAQLASLENQMITQKQRSQSACDHTNKIHRLTIAKNRAKSRFETAGARDTERNQIDKLEKIVAQRSMELSRLGRDLVQAKQAHDAKTKSLPKLPTIE